MKLKLKKENNVWHSGIWRGNGGISTLTEARHSMSFWHALGVFSIKNFIRHYRLVQWEKQLKRR